MLVPVEIDYGCDFGASDRGLWDAEYQANIRATAFGWQDEDVDTGKAVSTSKTVGSCAMPYDFINELEKMEPADVSLSSMSWQKA